MERRVERWSLRLLTIPLLGLGLVLCSCNRRTEAYVPPEQEPPAAARPVRIPSLAEARPSFEDVRPRDRSGAPIGDVGPQAQGGARIEGVIRIGEGESAPGSGVLFVIARAGAGPPLAVQRLEPRSFPVQFSLGPENTMMGRPFSGSMTLVARLDEDGNPMTRGDADLEGQIAGPVEPGASGLEIVLGRSDR